jgi:hypothetical protein
MNFPMEPYLALLLIGFLPGETWRWLGIVAYGAHCLQRSRIAAS